MRKRRHCNGGKNSSGCSVKLEVGSVLFDMTKTPWKLGCTIGAGSFGDIYLATPLVEQEENENASCVAKVEPLYNGPLFVEMNFYLRVGVKDKINNWKQERNLSHLGMPHLVTFGSHSVDLEKYRFIIIPRYGEDLATVFNRCEKRFSLKTALTIGLQIIDILEYIHYNGYVHADVKASNLMMGLGKGEEDKIYLVDFGLACSFVDSYGVHKEYGQDRRRAHDGTLEYTSRDAHIGAHSRRGDLETLGYNLIEWVAGKLPWANFLHDPDEVAANKNVYMANIPLFMTKCFPRGRAPVVLQNFLEYIYTLKFTTGPDYNNIRSMLRKGLASDDLTDDQKLRFQIFDRESDAENMPEDDSDFQQKAKGAIGAFRPLQVSQRRTPRLSGINDNTDEFDWVQVLQSNPERGAKPKKSQEETAPSVSPIVDDLDPNLRQPKNLGILNPTPQMLKRLLKWLLDLFFVDTHCSDEKIKLLVQWYSFNRLRFQLTEEDEKYFLSEKNRPIHELKNDHAFAEEYPIESNISAKAMIRKDCKCIMVSAEIRGKNVFMDTRQLDYFFSAYKLHVNNYKFEDHEEESMSENDFDHEADVTTESEGIASQREAVVMIAENPPSPKTTETIIRKTTQETIETNSEETTQKVTRQTAQKTIRQTTQQAPEPTIEEISQKAAQEKSQKVPQEKSQKALQEKSRKPSPEKTPKASQQVTQITTRQATPPIIEETTQQPLQETGPENTIQNPVPETTQKSIEEPATQNSVQTTTEKTTQEPTNKKSTREKKSKATRKIRNTEMNSVDNMMVYGLVSRRRTKGNRSRNTCLNGYHNVLDQTESDTSRESTPTRTFLERLRSTPARRQRSVTPKDTFYTPYRGPRGYFLGDRRRSRSRSRSTSPTPRRGRCSTPYPRTSNRRSESPAPRRNRGSTPNKRRTNSSKNDRRREERSPSPRNRSNSRSYQRRTSRSRSKSQKSTRRSEERCKSSPPRKRGRPSKKDLEERAAALKRTYSPPRTRGRLSKQDSERRSIPKQREPSPRSKSSSRSNRRRSPSVRKEYRNKYYSYSRSPSKSKNIFQERLDSPVIERDSWPWRLRRRSSTRPVNYSSLEERHVSPYATRSRTKLENRSRSPSLRKKTERSHSRSRSCRRSYYYDEREDSRRRDNDCRSRKERYERRCQRSFNNMRFSPRY